jgi:hypothetical protein
VSRKPTKGKESIALELFDRIEEYADELQEEADDKEPTLGSGTSIIVFCENFFAQFFRSFLGTRISGITYRSKMVAARQRRSLSAEKHQATRQLIAQFENLCDSGQICWASATHARRHYGPSSTYRFSRPCSSGS